MIRLWIVRMLVLLEAISLSLVFFGVEVASVLYECKPLEYSFIPNTCYALPLYACYIALFILVIAAVNYLLNRKKLSQLTFAQRCWYYVSIAPVILLLLFIGMMIFISLTPAPR